MATDYSREEVYQNFAQQFIALKRFGQGQEWPDS
jgi:hypothetical protein